jgi:hypothetical protein
MPCQNKLIELHFVDAADTDGDFYNCFDDCCVAFFNEMRIFIHNKMELQISVY